MNKLFFTILFLISFSGFAESSTVDKFWSLSKVLCEDGTAPQDEIKFRSEEIYFDTGKFFGTVSTKSNPKASGACTINYSGNVKRREDKVIRTTHIARTCFGRRGETMIEGQMKKGSEELKAEFSQNQMILYKDLYKSDDRDICPNSYYLVSVYKLTSSD